MNRKQNQSILLLLSIFFGAFVLLLLLLIGEVEAAPSKQSSCGRVTRSSGQKRLLITSTNRSCKTPRVLSSKGRIFVGGGGDNLVACDGFIVAEDTQVFGLFPDSPISFRRVLLNQPHIEHDIIVDACHTRDGEYQYTLRDPDNNVIASESNTSFIYDFPDESQLGTYVLTIETPLGTITENFIVENYDEPRLELLDPVTKEKIWYDVFIEETNLNRQNGIQVNYFGFPANDEIEVGLYLLEKDEDSPDTGASTLVDSWLFDTDGKGNFNEILEFSLDFKSGDYILASCSVKNCELLFGIPRAPNGIIPPPIAWDSFHLPEAELTARVDPSTGRLGLRMRSGPGLDKTTQYVLSAGSTLKILEGPEMGKYGHNWYRVRDNSTGREGWVSGKFLIFENMPLLPENGSQ